MTSKCSKHLLLAGACIFAAISFSSTASGSFVIDSLDGDITTNEINRFVSTINAMTPPTNNYNNDMSTHGTEVQGMRRMYEATGNIAILNRYIKFCDVALVHRNDQPQGEHRAMWTGNVEPIWPQSSTTTSAGCESGQVAGNIAYCALLILQTPSIWNTTVPDGNPYGYGATYKARAQTYITKVDETLSKYFTKWFVNPTTFRIRKPTDQRWIDASGNAAETAWNRQALTVSAYRNSAQAHDILNDNPSFLSLYKNVVNAFATWFVAPYPSGGGDYYTSGGKDVVKWYYNIPNDQHIENIGHAQHDVVGLFESFDSGYTTVTSDQVQVYVDTTQYIINLGTTDSWADNVDGTRASSSLKTDFIFFSQWNQPLYKMIAQSNIDDNTLNGSEGCKNTGYILYMKHWMFSHTGGTFEAEDLAVENSSGDVVRDLVETDASGGISLMNDTNAVGDFVTLRIPTIVPATYSVKVRFKKHPSRGIVQVMIGKIGGSLGNLGSPIDLYTASPAYQEYTVGTWTPGSISDKQISFKITGKNSASSGFTQNIDRITLVPQ